MDCSKCRFYDSFYSRGGKISCKKRHGAFCGETSLHLANRIGVVVNGINDEDACRTGTTWPHSFAQEDLISCKNYKELKSGKT